MRGKLIVISGPSAVGKDSVAKKLAESTKAFISVSATSRMPRKGEVDGITYIFLTKEEFKERIKNDDFFEYAIYNDNYYGTPKYAIEEKLNKGIDVILVIEVQGGLIVKEKIKEAKLIFLLPPSIEELKRRFEKRGIDTKEEIEKRIEIAKWEIEMSKKYDYTIINENIDETAKKIQKIVGGEE